MICFLLQTRAIAFKKEIAGLSAATALKVSKQLLIQYLQRFLSNFIIISIILVFSNIILQINEQKQKKSIQKIISIYYPEIVNIKFKCNWYGKIIDAEKAKYGKHYLYISQIIILNSINLHLKSNQIGSSSMNQIKQFPKAQDSSNIEYIQRNEPIGHVQINDVTHMDSIKQNENSLISKKVTLNDNQKYIFIKPQNLCHILNDEDFHLFTTDESIFKDTETYKLNCYFVQLKLHIQAFILILSYQFHPFILKNYFESNIKLIYSLLTLFQQNYFILKIRFYNYFKGNLFSTSFQNLYSNISPSSNFNVFILCFISFNQIQNVNYLASTNNYQNKKQFYSHLVNSFSNFISFGFKQSMIYISLQSQINSFQSLCFLSFLQVSYLQGIKFYQFLFSICLFWQLAFSNNIPFFYPLFFSLQWPQDQRIDFLQSFQEVLFFKLNLFPQGKSYLFVLKKGAPLNKYHQRYQFCEKIYNNYNQIKMILKII
ncbi:unnamed protein product [Paramecium sonneborni]|uniref:Transmembrane protein n=1 Tax=Paramecium sonneborni TaxID=65129 RepID=A0A8S1QNM2_9CILI|nr:unnamed protein product [Paramecium sonneborni]